MSYNPSYLDMAINLFMVLLATTAVILWGFGVGALLNWLANAKKNSKDV